MAHDTYHMMISLALDDELEEHERHDLNQHLKNCEACADVWENMAMFDRLLTDPVEVGPPSLDFTAAVMNRVENYETNRRWYPLVIGTLITSSVLAALTVAMPLILLTLGLDGIAAQWPRAGLILGYITQGISHVVSGFVFLFEALQSWLTFLFTDPIALMVVLSGLMMASTWIGIRESMRFTQATQQQTA